MRQTYNLTKNNYIEFKFNYLIEFKFYQYIYFLGG